MNKNTKELDNKVKLFITSYGLDTRYEDYMNSYKDIISLFKGKKVVIIPNAKKESDDRTDSQVALRELIKNGIDAKIVDLEKDDFDITEFEALYLSGGEPKNLVDTLISKNYYEDIRKFINQGNVVVGQSAGAMIFCKDYLDTTTGNLNVMHNGYDYSDKIIVPHYDNLPESLLDQIPEDVIKIKDKDYLIKLEIFN